MSRDAAKIWFGIALVVLAGALVATRTTIDLGAAPGATGEPAPEFTGIAAWINSEPLTLEDLRGSVAVIDFWTFSCVNCVRTFPTLRALYAHYRDAGLAIVGVHAPEFAFERSLPDVRAAVARHRIAYPVAVDNDMATWRAYRNQYWPRHYVLDADGRIAADYIGEGHDAALQSTIRRLLADAGATLPPPLELATSGPGTRITPEVYIGAERGGAQGSLSNPEGYDRRRVVRYAPVSERTVAQSGTGGVFFLEGPWLARDEYVEAAGPGASIVLPFVARDVYVVAAAARGSGRVRVRLDGVDPASSAGDDVRDSTIVVERSDLYSSIRLREQGRHVLRFDASEGVRLYTFTFG